MLDRRIPFYNVIMRCDTIVKQKPALPQGYTFSAYQPGYEHDWAKLESAIGDFSSETEACRYFCETYMQDMARLKRHSVFLLDDKKNVVGACLAWTDLRGTETVSSLHWLVLDEAYQGRGLGRALCAQTMKLFDTEPVYIHTQPWSWKAIALYAAMGFRLQKTDTFSHYENQYAQAIDVLRRVLPQERYRMLCRNTDE